MRRVLLCLPENMLTALDREAEADCLSRSEMMRRAFLWYLRPAARALRHNGATSDLEPENLYTDPDELFNILRQQKLKAGIRSMLRDMKRQRSSRTQTPARKKL